MKIVTLDYQEIKCKFIEFTNEGVIITTWEDESITIELSNINYITVN